MISTHTEAELVTVPIIYNIMLIEGGSIFKLVSHTKGNRRTLLLHNEPSSGDLDAVLIGTRHRKIAIIRVGVVWCACFT